uniref:hypothetical protein n=1 Tax=Enterococcus casseliflavus TaxID=37734 RepID=UPI0022E31617
ANTMKDGDEMTATHVLYYDEEQEEEVGREVDLENMDQTVHFVAPKREGELPKTGSTAGMITSVRNKRKHLAARIKAPCSSFFENEEGGD